MKQYLNNKIINSNIIVSQMICSVVQSLWIKGIHKLSNNGWYKKMIRLDFSHNLHSR